MLYGDVGGVRAYVLRHALRSEVVANLGKRKSCTFTVLPADSRVCVRGPQPFLLAAYQAFAAQLGTSVFYTTHIPFLIHAKEVALSERARQQENLAVQRARDEQSYTLEDLRQRLAQVVQQDDFGAAIAIREQISLMEKKAPLRRRRKLKQ